MHTGHSWLPQTLQQGGQNQHHCPQGHLLLDSCEADAVSTSFSTILGGQSGRSHVTGEQPEDGNGRSTSPGNPAGKGKAGT